MAKTTLELPDELMRAVRVRAANDRSRLKDVVADLIRRGLATEQRSVVHGARRVRLPLVICAHSAPPGEEPSPERVAELLLAEEQESTV